MSSYLSMFEVIEDEGPEYIAVYQVRNMCASIERTPDGRYLPTVSDTEYGDVVAEGQSLSTPELAAESALSLARGQLDAMIRAFKPFPAHLVDRDAVEAA